MQPVPVWQGMVPCHSCWAVESSKGNINIINGVVLESASTNERRRV